MSCRITHISLILLLLTLSIHSAHGAVITELSEMRGPVQDGVALPLAIPTTFVGNDEVEFNVNFSQPFVVLGITASSPNVQFLFYVDVSEAGGTTEYFFNFAYQNYTGITWTDLYYTISAESLTGAPLVVPGLDFDWPDKTALGMSSLNFAYVDHQETKLHWYGGQVVDPTIDTTLVPVDVPDFSEDYYMVITLEVPEPSAFTALMVLAGARVYRRQIRLS